MNQADKLNTFITTYTGKTFYPFNPNCEAIDIVDIAHALSQKVRWNGHTTVPYSVGAHSIQAARRAALHTESTDVIMAALMHDASEAYFADVPTPIKMYLPDINSMEDSIQRAVESAFGLPEGIMDCPVVKTVDKECLYFEAQQILNRPPSRLTDHNVLSVSNTIDSPEFSEGVSSLDINKLFLDTFYALGGGIQ